MTIFKVYPQHHTPSEVDSIDEALALAHSTIYFNHISHNRYKNALKEGNTVHIVYATECVTIVPVENNT